jgi:MerR family transcriptional regulator, light-induced transcriptional regulator
MESDQEIGVSIGVAAQMAGLGVETLRNWERRYGFPTPARSEGRQRLYALETVERLQLIARALAQGRRAGEVVPLSLRQLEALLGISTRGGEETRSGELFLAAARDPAHEGEGEVAALMDATLSLDGAMLDELLRRHWYRLGPVAFLEQVVARFLWRLGESWERGLLSVAHEHFASERLRDFLTAQWRPLSERSRGPLVICATLPGERHVLGLHMVAALVALSGWRVLFLGADLPLEELLCVVAQAEQPRALMISLAADTHATSRRALIETLRAQLSPDIALVLGGAGAPADVPGCRRLDDLITLTGWLAGQLRASASATP